MHESLDKRNFALGKQLVATPGALAALQESGQSPYDFLRRHLRLEQGDLRDEDHQLNAEAVKEGSRILSSYRLSNGTRIWVITEAVDDSGQRAATTLLLPEEY